MEGSPTSSELIPRLQTIMENNEIGLIQARQDRWDSRIVYRLKKKNQINWSKNSLLFISLFVTERNAVLLSRYVSNRMKLMKNRYELIKKRIEEGRKSGERKKRERLRNRRNWMLKSVRSKGFVKKKNSRLKKFLSSRTLLIPTSVISRLN